MPKSNPWQTMKHSTVGKLAVESVEMLKAVIDGGTYATVVARFGVTRTAVERRIKSIALELNQSTRYCWHWPTSIRPSHTVTALCASSPAQDWRRHSRRLKPVPTSPGQGAVLHVVRYRCAATGEFHVTIL
jgi:hypothetical protein